MGSGFKASEIPDLQGKVAIVTGGNGGIGLETVRQLSQHGAKVYMASRSEDKAKAAIDELKKEKGEADVHFIQIDLMKLESAKKCAEEFKAKEDRLDILVCNAGIMAVPYKLTDDGIEQSFQVNHLTHFALFKSLAPLMAETGKLSGHPARLVNLSSFAVSASFHYFDADSITNDDSFQHNFITFNPLLSPDFSNKEAVNRSMGPSQLGKYMRYSQAKLAAVLFSRELNKRYPGNEIRSGAVHPGFVASNLYKSTPLGPLAPRIFIKTSEGALSSLYVATSPEVEEKNSWCVFHSLPLLCDGLTDNVSLISRDTYLGTYGKKEHDSSYSKNEKLQTDLWTLSESLTSKL
jgi:NAD(P)-dependent dehydrogenase (short-subunit alcohol dehydrogenase family)